MACVLLTARAPAACSAPRQPAPRSGTWWPGSRGPMLPGSLSGSSGCADAGTSGRARGVATYATWTGHVCVAGGDGLKALLHRE